MQTAIAGISGTAVYTAADEHARTRYARFLHVIAGDDIIREDAVLDYIARRSLLAASDESGCHAIASECRTAHVHIAEFAKTAYCAF